MIKSFGQVQKMVKLDTDRKAAATCAVCLLTINHKYEKSWTVNQCKLPQFIIHDKKEIKNNKYKQPAEI